MPKTSTPIRLALRREGDWWVAYIATTINMEGAMEIGRVLINALDARVDGPDRWKALMTDVLAANLKDIGVDPIGWEERTSPESERSGRG